MFSYSSLGGLGLGQPGTAFPFPFFTGNFTFPQRVGFTFPLFLGKGPQGNFLFNCAFCNFHNSPFQFWPGGSLFCKTLFVGQPSFLRPFGGFKKGHPPFESLFFSSGCFFFPRGHFPLPLGVFFEGYPKRFPFSHRAPPKGVVNSGYPGVLSLPFVPSLFSPFFFGERGDATPRCSFNPLGGTLGGFPLLFGGGFSLHAS